MCVVSNVGDYYADRWRWVPQAPPAIVPNIYTGSTTVGGWISREEFDALKAEVAEMKELLIAAKRIDEITGQPDCEMADKVATLRRVADLVGVSLDDVLSNP